MSELAFDEDGQRFTPPAKVERWQTQRFNNPGKPGRPAVVYNDDGLPLFLDLETSPGEFREAVGGVPGRYRLVGVDANGRVVDGVPAAYLVLNGPATTSSGGAYSGPVPPPPVTSALEYAVIEMARANADAMKAMTDKISSVIDSAANMVRAADGASLPRRAPLGPLLVDERDDDDDDDDDDDEDNAKGAARPEPTVAGMFGQIMQMISMFRGTGGDPAKVGTVVVEAAKLVETTTSASEPAAPPASEDVDDEDDDSDTRTAPSNRSNGSNGAHGGNGMSGSKPNGVNGVNGAHVVNGVNGANVVHGAHGEATKRRARSADKGRAQPASAPASAPADPMVHFQKILDALSPDEQAQVRFVVTTLSVGDLMKWYEQLADMPVADAVVAIRAELAKPKEPAS